MTKPLKYDTDEAQILSIFPGAIEYGDFSGLEPGEIDNLHEWLEGYPADTVYEYGEESFFGECGITGWMGDVITVTTNYNFREESDYERQV